MSGHPNRQGHKIEPQVLGQDAIMQFLNNQAKQIELTKTEQSLREKDLNNSHSYAIKALEAQVSDTTQNRKHVKDMTLIYLGFGLIVFVICIFSVCYLLHTGHKELAEDILKIGGSAVLSGAGGFFIGKSKASKKESNTE